MLAKSHKHLSKITRHLNRAHLQKNRLLARQKAIQNTIQNTSGKMRTRTLIQLGGLLEKAKLLLPFDIQPGDDLQRPENLSKAASLLGFLKTMENETLFTEEALAAYQIFGEMILKTNR